MTEDSPELENIKVVVEMEGLTEEAANELRQIFDGEDEDVIFSHAFGGADVVSIITMLGKGTFGKLIDYFAKRKTAVPKTSLKIGKNSVAMSGFSRADIEALLASPGFQKALKSTHGK